MMKRLISLKATTIFTFSLCPSEESVSDTYIQIFGPAFTTSGGQPPSYFLKLSINREARLLYLSSCAFLLGHESAGFKMPSGTSGHVSGTSKPKTESFRYFTFSSEPSSAALSKERVYLMLIRLPIPNGPPIQPVFNNQQCTPYFKIFLFNRSA
jgi:hypothetical protein